MTPCLKQKRDELLKNMCNWAVMGTVGEDPKLPYMKHAFDAAYALMLEEFKPVVKAMDKFINSEILNEVDFINYSEAYSDVKERLAQFKERFGE